MAKEAKQPLLAAVSVAVAVLLFFFVVSVLASQSDNLQDSAPQPVYSGHPLDKLDRELTLDRRGASILMGEEARVIIRLNTQPSVGGIGVRALSERGNAFEQAKSEVLAALQSGLSAAGEDKPVKDLRIINSIAVTVPTRKLNQLAYLDAIEYISEDKSVHALLDNSVALVGAPQVWAMNDSQGLNVTGQNITIAIIDSGIDYTHADLGNCTNASFLAENCSKVIAGYDWVNSDGDPMDDYGHGTHCAGIAAANGTLKGMAPDALLIAYRVLDENGDGRASNVIAAIERATDPNQDSDTSDHYDIISLSLGTSGNPDDALSQAADTAVNAGVIVVAAAGNSGPDLNTIRSPGTAREAITVGNTYDNDTIRSTSSRGPVTSDIKPDLTAPGVDIYSTVPTGSCEVCDSSGYANSTGTSMSAPHVSGAAALIKQLHPDWTPDTIKGALIGYTKDVGLRAIDQGSGRLLINESINAPIIGGKPSRNLGTVSSSAINTTAVFNITNLLNESINVTLNVTIVTNNASASLNQSNVSIAANSTANIELLVNWSQGTERYVDGRITADNLTIPFTLEIAGFRTVEIENIGANKEITESLIRDIDNDGLNEIIMSYDDFADGRVRYAKYNSTSNTWNLTTIASINVVQVVSAGDVDNDSLNEVVSGDWDGVFRVFEYNTSNASWIETYNFTTVTDAIEEIDIGDVDNDTTTEVILGSYNSSETGRIWQFKLINGTWNYTILLRTNATRVRALTIGDGDDDGLLEIFHDNVISSQSRLEILENINGTWNNTLIDTITQFQATIEGIKVADPDEDGTNEIVVAGGNTTWGYVFIYEYQGNNTWNRTSIYTSSTEGRTFHMGVGDANNDGIVDIAIGHRSGNGIRLLERNSDNVTWTASIVLQNIDANTLVRGVDTGDATNNGLNEISSGSGGGTGIAASRVHYLIEDPRITNLQTSVSQPTKQDRQTFTARVQDSDGLDTVVLYWRNGTVDWNEVNMSLLDTQNYTANISAQPWNTTIDYFVKATDLQSDLNQTAILNYTVLVNRIGNVSNMFTNLTNLTVWIANSSTLNATYYNEELVQFKHNSTVIVEFNFSFPNNVLDLRNVTVNASQDNTTGWVLVKNLSLPAGVNKTLYLQHLNLSAGFVCIKDAEVSSIHNISASCAGTNETLVQCNNVTVSGYKCENVSNWWKITGATHTAAKEMGNLVPVITATGPSSPVTSSSTSLSATTNEVATCKYSTTQGQAYSAMPNNMSGTGTSHTASLTVSNGDYTYYTRCQDSNGANSSESTITFTVSITTSSGGGGGGAAPVTDKNKKETTYASIKADTAHKLFVERDAIAATKAGFVNTVQARNVKFSVSTVNDSDLGDKPDKAYSFFNITLTGLQTHELSSAWIEFKMNKSWLSEQSAEKEDVRLKRYSSGLWKELDTVWTKDTASYSYFNATTPGFSIFAIALAAKEPEPEPVVNITPEPEVNITVELEVNQTVEPPEPPQPPEEKPSAWKWVIGIMLVLLIAAALIMLGKGRRPRRARSALEKGEKVRGQFSDYIAKCREKGYNDDKIRKALLEKGWNKDLVERGLRRP